MMNKINFTIKSVIYFCFNLQSMPTCNRGHGGRIDLCLTEDWKIRSLNHDGSLTVNKVFYIYCLSQPRTRCIKWVPA
jgi:hypothetical protein